MEMLQHLSCSKGGGAVQKVGGGGAEARGRDESGGRCV